MNFVITIITSPVSPQDVTDLLVELEEYFDKRQDADYEGEETRMVPNKEMWFYAQIKELLDKL